MKVTPSQYAQALYTLSKSRSLSECSRLASDFVSLVQRNGDTKKLPRILYHVQRLHEQETARKRVFVSSAFPIHGELLQSLERYAQEVFESPKVILDISVDKKLLGGVIMQTENQRVDASVSSVLNRMRTVLLQ